MVMNSWEIIHAYHRLVKSGDLEPLTCFCGTEYITRIGFNDEPALWCGFDDATIQVGKSLLSRIRQAVEDTDLQALM